MRAFFNHFRRGGRLQSPENAKTSVITVTAYYPPHLGGVEKVAQEIARQTVKQGYRSIVLTSDTGSDGAAESTEDGVHVKRLRSTEIGHTPFALGLFWQLLRAPKPALYHVHLAQAFFPEVTWLASKLRGIPYIAHYHLDVKGSGGLGFLFKLYKQSVQKAVIYRAAAVIVLSEEQKREVHKMYGVPFDRISVVPNGVAAGYLADGLKNRHPRNPLRLLFVGRLVVQKRVERLIQALTLTIGPVTLTIVGDGEDRAALEMMVTELGLKNVKFKGALYGKALRQAYRAADVFVLPSDREGMPLALFEAMASGLPVIGADVPGIREHISGVGELVKNPSPSTFAQAIQKLAADEGLQAKLSKQSRTKAAGYSWKELAVKIGHVYAQVSRPARPTNGRWLPAMVVFGWLTLLGMCASRIVPDIFLNFYGSAFLIFVPGLLTVVSLPLQHLNNRIKAALCVGFSLLELMTATLAGNTVMQWMGIKRPLDASFLAIDISVLLLVLLTAAGKYASIPKFNWHFFQAWNRPTKLELIIAATPLLFVILSAFGAYSLNNGGTNAWTLAMLAGMVPFSGLLLLVNQRLSDNSIAAAIFFMGLALLLMTSLRGWHITGHDIQREFRVFELAKTTGVWQIQRYRDAYNACLSITLLPTIFSNLLRVPDAYIFKALYQLLFAMSPVVIYLTARQWTSRAVAYMAAFYVISFPTFFGDMPMLGRQEIAFLFYALLLYLLAEGQISVSLKRKLFLGLGIGLIFSHYATTYSLLIILLFAAISRPLMMVLLKKMRRIRLFDNYDGATIKAAAARGQFLITWPLLLTLVLASFLWTSAVTNTGDGIQRLARETLTAVKHGFKDSHASDANTLLARAKADPQLRLNSYVDNVVIPGRQVTNEADLYPLDAASQKLQLAEPDTVSLTPFSRFLQAHRLKTTIVNNFTRHSVTLLVELLVVVGLVYALTRNDFTDIIGLEYYSVALASLLFVMLTVLLPFLSVEYGLLRALQQAFFALGLFVILGSIGLAQIMAYCSKSVLQLFKVRFYAGTPKLKKVLLNTLPIVLGLLFFLYSSGVMTQLVGGYKPLLHLNNKGDYYNSYYTHGTELASAAWLARLASDLKDKPDVQSEVQANRYAPVTTSGILDANKLNDITPGLLRRSAYVYLGYTNVVKRQASVSYLGDLVTYYYPLDRLDDEKNLIYDNGQSRVYQ